jgi:hypothetical protein
MLAYKAPDTTVHIGDPIKYLAFVGFMLNDPVVLLTLFPSCYLVLDTMLDSAADCCQVFHRLLQSLEVNSEIGP